MNVENNQIFIFPSGGGKVSYILSHLEGLNPTKDGILIHRRDFLNLEVFSDRVNLDNGEIVNPKNITRKIGFFADFMDTEGKIVSLHLRG